MTGKELIHIMKEAVATSMSRRGTTRTGQEFENRIEKKFKLLGISKAADSDSISSSSDSTNLFPIPHSVIYKYQVKYRSVFDAAMNRHRLGSKKKMDFIIEGILSPTLYFPSIDPKKITKISIEAKVQCSSGTAIEKLYFSINELAYGTDTENNILLLDGKRLVGQQRRFQAYADKLRLEINIPKHTVRVMTVKDFDDWLEKALSS